MVSGTVILVGIIGGISGGYISSVLTNAYRDWRGNKVNVEPAQLTGHVRAEACSGDTCKNDPDFMTQKNDELIQRIESFNEKHQLFINGDSIKQLNTEDRRIMSTHLAMILCEVTRHLKATDMPTEKCSGDFYEGDHCTEQDRLMEQDIQALNLTAPRVESASIDDIMSRVRYVVSVVKGTTTTLATAVTSDGFTLAIGQTSCVDPDNFNASVGAKWAIEDAKKKARDELWKLEGWRLKRELTQGKVKQ